MPTYEYQCKSCHHRFEIWQKMADEPLSTCPECSGSIRRILFPAGIVFKGSGFYKTDHGSGAVASETNPNGQDIAKETATTKAESGNETKSGSEKGSTPAPTDEKKTSTPAPAKVSIP